MAIAAGEIVEISVRGTWLAQQWTNVWQFQVVTTLGDMTAAQLGEGFWNHVKDAYRALASAGQSDAFLSVLVKSLDDAAGAYGEYSVPSGERAGTRPSAGLGELIPSFNAAGVRLSVGTRLTKPGQKRFVFLHEVDVTGNSLNGGFQDLLVDLLDVMTVQLLLGAPVATVSLDPVVVRKGITGLAVLDQPVTGYAVNSFVATQLSRKIGYGN